ASATRRALLRRPHLAACCAARRLHHLVWQAHYFGHAQNRTERLIDSGVCWEGLGHLGIEEHEVGPRPILRGVFAPNAPLHRSEVVLGAEDVCGFAISLLHKTFVRDALLVWR